MPPNPDKVIKKTNNVKANKDWGRLWSDRTVFD